MDSSECSHWQIDEEDNESIVEDDRRSTSQIEGSEHLDNDHSKETTPPADHPQEALRDVYGDLTDKLYSPSLVEHDLRCSNTDVGRIRDDQFQGFQSRQKHRSARCHEEEESK